MERLTSGKILRFWLPLASTWAMMSVEGPLLAAVIARTDEPKLNLAAYGIAFSLAMMIESPIINMMAAATAMVRDRLSYLKLLRFTTALNVVITLVMLLAGTPVFDLLAHGLLGMPGDVVGLARRAILFLLPWPAAIGYRRFYQGVLIAAGKTRRVAAGTLMRLAGMSTCAFCLYGLTELPGALVGALSLSAGVTVEVLVVRMMAADCIRDLRGREVRASSRALTFGSIGRFYFPLALTSVLALAAHPMIVFLAGLGAYALESLAVLPVVNSLVFIFRAVGLSYQEAIIALLSDHEERRATLRRFSVYLAAGSALALSAIAFTPLSTIWFENVSALSPELASFALLPTGVMAMMPALTVLLVWQRSVLVHSQRTNPVTWASMIEVVLILGAMLLGLFGFSWTGALSATVAYMVGRLGACLYLTARR